MKVRIPTALHMESEIPEFPFYTLCAPSSGKNTAGNCSGVLANTSCILTARGVNAWNVPSAGTTGSGWLVF